MSEDEEDGMAEQLAAPQGVLSAPAVARRGERLAGGPCDVEVQQSGRQVTTSSGGTAVLGPKATFGTVTSGGQY